MRSFMGTFLVLLLALVFVRFGQLSAFGQQTATSGAWLEQLDRDHSRLVSPTGHVHGTARVEAVDIGPGTITLQNAEVKSRDMTIWMPPMRMTYHTTNRRMLHGVRPGDFVEFEAARLRNALMITKMRKVR